VIKTKTAQTVKELGENYALIGPYEEATAKLQVRVLSRLASSRVYVCLSVWSDEVGRGRMRACVLIRPTFPCLYVLSLFFYGDADSCARLMR
jgi:hypothetical protein